MRQMFDSVVAERLPADATLVGAYVDGRYANEQAVRARCPRAAVVTITVTGKPGAHVADCETGDLSPTGAAEWAVREVSAGRRPTIYCNSSTWPAVQQECRNRSVWPNWWIAQYDGVADIPAGAVAKQYQERTDQNLDYSLAADHWPGVDPTSEEPVTPQEIEQIAQKVVELLHPIVATHDDMRTLLHGTQDGSHPYNLTTIGKALGVGQ